MSDLATIYATLLAVLEELRKVPKSDSNIVLNATALAQLRTQMDEAAATVNITDRLDHATFGLEALSTRLGTPAGADIAADIAAIAAIVGPAKTLSPANDTVEQGFYAATTLDAVDADLAPANIKTGVTIFGKLGTYDTEADNPITAGKLPTGDVGFVNGAKITGTGTKTLSDANDTVEAGYYAATTLHEVDADLASGNIKSGVTIFGIAGAATVQDISDADAVEADVAAGKTFYSITGARKTGTAGA